MTQFGEDLFHSHVTRGVGRVGYEWGQGHTSVRLRPYPTSILRHPRSTEVMGLRTRDVRPLVGLGPRPGFRTPGTSPTEPGPSGPTSTEIHPRRGLPSPKKSVGRGQEVRFARQTRLGESQRRGRSGLESEGPWKGYPGPVRESDVVSTTSHGRRV